MIPTRRLAAFAGIAALVAVAAGYVPSLDPALLALDALIVLAAAIDAAIAAGRRVEAERDVAAIFSVGRANAVTLRLKK